MNLQRVIERAVCRPVEITLTNNRTSIVSFKREQGRVLLRVQRLFTEAPLEVILEIAELIRKPSIKTPLVHAFFRKNQWRVRKRSRAPDRVEPEGRVYNLREIFEKVNREYFPNEIEAVITWGKRSPKKAVRKRTLGSYNSETKTIRINPGLDCVRVPGFFIEFIVYHEMLHADIGILRRKNGRRAIHTREFRERERLFRDYRQVLEWEKKARMHGFCP